MSTTGSDDLMVPAGEGTCFTASSYTASSSSKKSKRFEIIEWNAVSFRVDAVATEICTICLNKLVDPCSDCQAAQLNSANQDCTLDCGECSHFFHSHCIRQWGKPLCPLDKGTWKLTKTTSRQ